MQYPKKFKHLISHFSALPSIGPKMAERLVLYLFKQDEKKLLAFAEAIEDLHHLKSCARCFYIAETELCEICADSHRDASVICVVEEPLDVIAIERTSAFWGLYHVLGGVMDMSREQEVAALKISELVARVTLNSISEVILATNPTTEGDVTALYIKKKLDGSGVKVTRIARGLATGGDIEYADEASITASLTNRK
jgi:recombination protein RecR